MKKGIHPKWNKDVQVMFNGKAIMTVGSTRESLNVEIWAGNHPFYTGKEMLVDTDNLVDKFNKKLKQAEGKAVVKKETKRARRTQSKQSSYSAKPLTLKDMLQDFK